MTDIRLFGYCDPLSAQAGKPIDFMVSAEGTDEVRAELVRLVHGDFNPEGPGFIEESVAADIPAHLPVRRQYTQNGSFARVKDPEGHLAPDGPFTLFAFIRPSNPHGARQCILGRWSVSRSVGYGLGITPDGKLEFWVGDGKTVD